MIVTRITRGFLEKKGILKKSRNHCEKWAAIVDLFDAALPVRTVQIQAMN
jgi:hypothetical protein